MQASQQPGNIFDTFAPRCAWGVVIIDPIGVTERTGCAEFRGKSGAAEQSKTRGLKPCVVVKQRVLEWRSVEFQHGAAVTGQYFPDLIGSPTVQHLEPDTGNNQLLGVKLCHKIRWWLNVIRQERNQFLVSDPKVKTVNY